MSQSLNLSLGSSLAAVFLALAAPAFAQETKKDANSTEVIAKKDVQTPASTIDFAKAYELPFESLAGIGARIEASRRHPDPVALASLANELAVAEAVSGKKADITAENLAKEAVELVLLRDDATELKAVALIVKDKTIADKLEQKGKAAAEREKERIASYKRGETPRGIHRAIVVHNRSDVVAHVHANGYYIGHVHPYQDRVFPVDFDTPVVVLSAHGAYGHHWHEHAHGEHEVYHFVLPE